MAKQQPEQKFAYRGGVAALKLGVASIDITDIDQAAVDAATANGSGQMIFLCVH